MEYNELIEIITNKVLENHVADALKKTNWDSIIEVDKSFGGTLKLFSGALGIKNVNIIVGEFGKGEGLKKHYHKPPAEEVYYILEGEVELTIDNLKKIIKKGDIIFVKPNIVHRPINQKDNICRILFILSPIEKESPVIVE